MPLYEYECETCGKRFELIQKFSDPPADTCPTCGAHVRKLLSSPAIQFKGTGWYVSDYPSKTRSEGSSAGGSEKKSPSPSGDSKPTESKSGGDSATPSAPAPSTKPSSKPSSES